MQSKFEHRIRRVERLIAQSDREAECFMCNAYPDDPHKQFPPHKCIPASALPAILKAIDGKTRGIPSQLDRSQWRARCAQTSTDA